MDHAEYQTLRQGAGLADLPDRGRMAIAGSDRGDYLQGLLTNDVAALQPGGGCYAAYLTPQGRMIADMHVLADAERILLDVDAGVRGRLLQRFDDLIFTEDVTVADLTDSWAAFGVHGPAAGEVAAAVAGDAAATMALYENRTVPVDEGAVVVARIDDLGVIGYRFYVESHGAAVLRQALVDAGAAPVGAEALEAIRVESGRPVFPVDMDEDTIPLEAGIADRAISYDKGCYVGQEVIVRIMHRGQGRVARRLVGLTLSSSGGDAEGAESLPFAGSVVCRGDVEVGRVTSAVRSPTLGHPIALGYVPRELADELGAELDVAAEHGRVRGVVTALPFVAP